MTTTVLLLVPLLAAVVLVLGFAGCTAFGTETPIGTSVTGPPLVVEPPVVEPPPPPGDPTYEAVITAPGLGLLSWWRFAETGGGVAFDARPAAINGEYVDDLTRAEAAGALAPRLPGDVALGLPGTGGHVRVDFDPRLNVSDLLKFTFEVWLKRRPAEEVAGESTFLASNREFEGANSRGWELFCTHGAGGALRVRGRVYAGTSADSVEADVPVSLQTAAPEAWHHVVLAYDGERKTVSVHVHVVGEPGSFSKTTPVSAYAPAVDGRTPLRLGAANRPLPAAFLHGSLDEAAFYLHAFDVNEAQRNFRAATP